MPRGPALANLAHGSWEIWLFTGAMIGGIALSRLATRGHPLATAPPGTR